MCDTAKYLGTLGITRPEHRGCAGVYSAGINEHACLAIRNAGEFEYLGISDGTVCAILFERKWPIELLQGYEDLADVAVAKRVLCTWLQELDRLG